jgi:hypothetical protein
MKRLIMTLLAAASTIPAGGCSDSINRLFTGKDLIGWAAFPPDKTSLWSVKNGVIFCQGPTLTYLRSEKEYGNYHFHCEWRWPDRPGDGGIGLHTTGPDSSRPNSIEVQLNSPDAGDLFLVGPDLSASKMDLLLRTDHSPVVRIPKELADTENLPGQWNSLDVFCKENTIRIFINGFPQNEVINVSRSRGSLCLISRGAPIEFQNLYLNPLR